MTGFSGIPFPPRVAEGVVGDVVPRVAGGVVGGVVPRVCVGVGVVVPRVGVCAQAIETVNRSRISIPARVIPEYF
jgi:hypothetical protein